MSWRAALVRWAIRRKFRRGRPAEDTVFGLTGVSGLDTQAAVEKVRRALDDASAAMPAPPRGSSVERIEAGAIRGEWITARDVSKETRRVILYCHGGGYFWGNLSVPRNMLARLSALAGARVFSLDYRLAPEAPWPAALEDAAAAHAWLIDGQGVDPDQFALGGESAGGGLALSLMTTLKKEGRPLPRAAFLFSPWTDLTVSGVSIEANAKADPALTGADLRWAAALTLNGADARTASPLFSDLSGLPPVLVQVGSTEILLDDARRLADAVQRCGGHCTLEVWPRMHHVWQQHSFFVPEGRRALAAVAGFISQSLAADQP